MGVDIQTALGAVYPAVEKAVELGEASAEFTAVLKVLALIIELIGFCGCGSKVRRAGEEQELVFAVTVQIGNVYERAGGGEGSTRAPPRTRLQAWVNSSLERCWLPTWRMRLYLRTALQRTWPS